MQEYGDNHCLRTALLNRNAGKVISLIKDRADVNEAGKYSRDIFSHLAAQAENKCIVKHLIENGANGVS